MDDFEQRLRMLPVARPSAGLRDRIFASRPRQTILVRLLSRRIAMGWAAVLVVTAGAAGFALSRLWDAASIHSVRQSSIELRIVEAASTRHDFDLTGTKADFLTGKVSVEIETQQEI